MRLALLFVTCLHVFGLFEEQVGEYDWYHAGLGRVTHVLLSPLKRFAYVATQESVIAAVQMKTGKITWRQVLPEGEAMNDLKLFQEDLLTVSDGGRIHRLWCRENGTLLWEDWTHSADNSLYHLAPALKRKVKQERAPPPAAFDTDDIERGSAVPQVITLFNDTLILRESEGQKIWSWQHNGGPCLALFTGGFVLCSQDGILVLISMGLKEGKSTSSTALDIPAGLPLVKSCRTAFCLDFKTNTLYVIDARGSRSMHLPVELGGEGVPVLTDIGLTSGFLLEREHYRAVVRIGGGGCDNQSPHTCPVELQSEVLPVGVDMLVLGQSNGDVLFATYNKGRLTVSINKPGTGTTSHLLDSVWTGHGRPLGVWGNAAKEEFLVVGEDHSLSMLKAGGPVWTREESLASIDKLMFIDLATEEMGGFPSLPIRIVNTLESMTHIPSTISAWVNELTQPQILPPFENDFSQILPLGKPAAIKLEKDTFGFRKILIVSTEPGKLIGMDSATGTILWTHFLGARIKDIIEIRHTHIVAVTSSLKTGTKLHHFDPVTGHLKETITSPFRIDHVLKLPTRTNDGTHVALLMDHDFVGHVLPDTPEANALVTGKSGAIFFYRMAVEAGHIAGYGVTKEGQQLKAYERWKLVFPAEEQISSAATRDDVEIVHSSLRITGDSTFLRKYVNANLMAIATVRKGSHSGSRLLPTVKKGTDPCVNIYLIDSVTGRILEKLVHRGGVGPVSVEVTENTVVFQYWNAESFQHEVSVVDLYEDPAIPAETAVDKFSAFKAGIPVTQQQSYILRVGVSTISVTQSSRGISSKLFLLGLTNGQILGVGRAIFDPQRPTGTPSEADKFQGLFPYTPEIIVDPTAILNYNRTIHNMRGIVTSPVLLESTSVVLAYGLDLFYTRAQGSGAFDLLNEDFNYPFLILSVTSVVVGIFVSHRAASAKALKMAWK
jgi:outer membrane protein assembly factor BamB